MVKSIGGTLVIFSRISGLSSSTRHISSCIQRRTISSKSGGPSFGLVFDIDGVIVRGRTLLPSAKEAFQLLTDHNNKFLVPSIFVTNAGNTLRQNKAKQLSNWLDLDITEEQVVMSHSPLRMFRQFHDKHVLVCGQGPTKEIAKHIGFSKVTTIETFRHCFPMLDMVDHARRKTAPCGFEQYFPRIEAVVLFGEPVRWETYLQLIIDVLITNGLPAVKPTEIAYPHLPVLACNMDLMWMAEAPMPRFAHGSFLNCLESLYQKIAGHELQYTALMGKPSEITYHHADNILQTEARQLGFNGVKRMYCIGDNPDVDIYGSNLYNRYLHTRKQTRVTQQTPTTPGGNPGSGGGKVSGMPLTRSMHSDGLMAAEAMVEEEIDSISMELNPTGRSGSEDFIGTEDCKSVLVCTGVYQKDSAVQSNSFAVDHNHRDFILDNDLKQPSMISDNVLQAIQSIFKKEGIS